MSKGPPRAKSKGPPDNSGWYGRVLSLTRVKTDHGTVVVYREQKVDVDNRLEPYFDLEDQDIHDEVKKYHPSFLAEMAKACMSLPGVVKVVAMRNDGKGIQIEA